MTWLPGKWLFGVRFANYLKYSITPVASPILASSLIRISLVGYYVILIAITAIVPLSIENGSFFPAFTVITTLVMIGVFARYHLDHLR